MLLFRNFRKKHFKTNCDINIVIYSSTIPPLFIKCYSLFLLMKLNLSKVRLSNNDNKCDLNIPTETSLELVELIGIFAGDGYISPYVKGRDYRLSVFLNLIDELPYLQYINDLIFSVFNLRFLTIVRESMHTAILKKDSKGLVSFFYSLGYSKNNSIISVPEWIWNNKNYTLSFLKGIFDTDGTLSLKKKHGKNLFYPVANIGLKDISLVNEISKRILDQQIPHSLYMDIYLDKRTNEIYTKKVIQISGYQNVEKWMNLVKPSNTKHIERWQLALLTRNMGRG